MGLGELETKEGQLMGASGDRPKLTVLTDPVLWGREFVSEGPRKVVRYFKYRVQSHEGRGSDPIYRGHFAVTRSLVEGLGAIDASFNYNPVFPNELADVVIVLAGVRTLRQAIRLKQRGLIRKLFAGPNIVTFSSDDDFIIASPEISLVITPSEWVVDMYKEDSPCLGTRCFSWPAGINTRYWTPGVHVPRDRLLIFEKYISSGLTRPYVDYLCGLGWRVDVIEYGSFSHSEYLSMLKRSCLMIGFSMSESQGIAWAEAWAADVPTLISRNDSHVHRGRIYRCSTAPYLRPENGMFFTDFEDFKLKFSYWEAHRDEFSPRDWTMKNMSDDVCASLLYKKAIEC